VVVVVMVVVSVCVCLCVCGGGGGGILCTKGATVRTAITQETVHALLRERNAWL
jgi:hypothetical protein